MNALLISLLLLAPEDPPVDELEALQNVITRALERIDPSVVTIESVGGVRQIHVPDSVKEQITLPERPREGDRNAPEDSDPDEEVPPEGRTPRFKDEWRKMLAWPGFTKAEGPTTGVIVSADGYVITSAWNFEGKPTVVTATTSDGRLHAARLLGIDRAAGLALIKLDGEGFRPATFLEDDAVRVGAWAFAVGRAVSRQATTVKYGIVSARNRIDGRALQTDAATNPSNYGGPLIDAEGRVYGIIVPLGAQGEEANPNWYDSGIGFAVPVPDPRTLIERLKEQGTELFPAFLGVATDQDRTEPGALVTEVVPDTSAALLGLKKGDVILSVDGEAVTNAFSLRFEVGRRRAGDTIKLEVRRGEETFTIDVELGRRPEPGSEDKIPIPVLPGGVTPPDPPEGPPGEGCGNEDE